jgi:AcrR family transcriptional regulator
MARPRSATYDDQRGQILARAAELFATRGFPATSMNEVARACGLSKPALYHYFTDKDALLLDIAVQHVSRLVKAVEAVQGEPAWSVADPPQRLRRLIEALVAEYAGARQAHRVLTDDVRFLGDGDRERVLDKQRAVVRAFAAEVVRLRPDAEPEHLVKPLTMLLFGMVNWMFTWHRDNGPVSHAQMAPIVAELFVAGAMAVRLSRPDPAARDPEAGRPAEPPEADLPIEARIVELLQQRAPDHSICPSDVARSLNGDEAGWRALMPEVRRVASRLGSQARIRITQGGTDLPADDLQRIGRGAIRLRRGPRFDEPSRPS